MGARFHLAREHIGSFVDDFFLLLLVEETLWELKICKWHCDSPFGVCASLLSGLILYNSFPAATDLVEDDVGGGFPDERSWLVVPMGQPFIDRALQFVDAMEGSATDHAVGDQAEQPLDLVEPGTTRGREMKVEASPLLRF